MDLNTAIQKHAEWKYKLRTAMEDHTHLDAAMISKDNCCEFGQWLHGEAKVKYAKFSHYANCVTAHAEFHVAAGKIAAAINANKNAEAEKMLATGSPYVEASKKVGLSIIELKNEIGR